MVHSARAHFPLVALGMLALLAALWAGLLRLGWQIPPLVETLAGVHGPLMISGFLGTLVSLERAVALKVKWSYLAPLASGIGAIFLIVGAPAVGPWLITLASFIMVAISANLARRQFAMFTAVLLLGAIYWVIGNVLWLSGGFISESVPWWAAFLVMTIAGERLELGRLVRVGVKEQRAFLAIIGLLEIGLIGLLFDFGWGVRIAGLGLIALALWLLANDIARRTVQSAQGLTRFIAQCMLAGYFWLGISGVLWIAFGARSSGLNYDASLHTLFLGFVFSMIFGHAPIILPAVLGGTMKMHRAFYVHFVLLQLSLLLRVGGDLLQIRTAQQWGGMLNVIAVLVFLANTLRAARAAPR